MTTEQSLDLGKQIVVFIGPEWSGKTTIAKRVVAQSQKPYISTGDIIRELALTDQTSIGDECRAMQNEKRYLDPKLLITLLLNRLRQADTQEGFILDGGLRTLDETRNFPSMLERAGRVMPLSVVYLNIPQSVSIERLMSAGDESRQRGDDTISGLLKRLSHFNDQLEERLAFIEEHKGWRLLEVDATGTPEQVYHLVCQRMTARPLEF